MARTVQLKDIATIITGNTPKTSDEENYASDDICFIKPGDISESEINELSESAYYISESARNTARLAPKGSILVTCIGTIGKTAILARECAFNQQINAVVPNTNFIDVHYLAYAIASNKTHMQEIANAAVVPIINKSDFSKLSVIIPPLEEQQRISRILEKIRLLISHRKQQLAKLDELVKARFVEMFGDPVLNQKKFLCYRVNDVIEFQGGSQPDKKYFEYMPTADNIRLIQIRDYKSDRYKTYIPKSLAKRFCTADDIMIGRYGPPIFQILSGIEGSFNVALMKAIPKMGNKEFIRQYLKQECLLKYLEGLSKRTAGQDGIQMDKLKAYPLPFPPIELQNEFANFSEQIGNFKLTIQQSLDKLEVLKKALMQEYFG